MSWNDNTWTLEPSYCKECGKEFYPTPMHVYKDSRGVFCSWTCYRKEYHANKNRIKGKPPRQVEQCTLDGTVVKTHGSPIDAAFEIDGTENAVRLACRTGEKYKNYLWRYKQNEMPKV